MSWLRNLLASFFGSKRKQSASLSLNEVVIAMNDVVRESRRIFEQDFPRQLSNRFFNKDGTPISKRFQFQELDGSWKSLDVPLISLIPADPLQIRRVTFEFEANVIVEPTEDKRTTRKDLEIVIGGKPKAAHTPVILRFGSEAPRKVRARFRCPTRMASSRKPDQVWGKRSWLWGRAKLTISNLSKNIMDGTFSRFKYSI